MKKMQSNLKFLKTNSTSSSSPKAATGFWQFIISFVCMQATKFIPWVQQQSLRLFVCRAVPLINTFFASHLPNDPESPTHRWQVGHISFFSDTKYSRFHRNFKNWNVSVSVLCGIHQSRRQYTISNVVLCVLLPRAPKKVFAQMPPWLIDFGI